MYENVVYMGKTLKEWCKLLANEYTLGELYRMSKENIDFSSMCNEAGVNQ